MLLFLISSTPTLAHVVVKPSEVGAAARVNFVVSVPTEENFPTTEVRLIIPEGLQSVRPNVKPGWNIRLVKDASDEAKIKEIVWSGGSIPAEQRDEFVFSAQAPAKTGELIWKAYQTYQAGDVVAWDADPKLVEQQPEPQDGADLHSALKPYSVTKVINDLAPSATQPPAVNTDLQSSNPDNLPLIISVIALIGAGFAIWMSMKSKTPVSTSTTKV